MDMKTKKPECRVVTITPQLAELWLEKRDAQRKVSQLHVDCLARMMESGDWQDLNGDTIVFDRNGNVIDGQHRLLAVIKSNIHITTDVALGREPTAIYSIDQGGKKRIFKDFLEIEGKENTEVIAAALRRLHYYRKNAAPGSTARRLSPSVQELSTLLKKNPAIYDSVLYASSIKGLLPPSMGVYFHYIFTEIELKKAEEFFRILCFGTGEDGVKKGCPVAILAKTLRTSRQNRQYKITPTQQQAITIIAWNYYREGRKVKFLRWTQKGERKSEFPRPR